MADNRSIVVTGVSSGIGHAVAAHAIVQGALVFGSVRTAEDATRLRRELGGNFTPLLFDVRDEAALAREAERVSAALGGRTLSGLVNNAGEAEPGPALLQPWDEIRDQIDVNLMGVIATTRAFAPLLGADRTRKGAPGRIVMMSSIAGALGQPFMSAYVASKHALEGYADALRVELQTFGIDVVTVAPALVATPIWEKAKPFAGRYAGTPYAQAFDRALTLMTEAGERQGLPDARIAEVVWTALTAKRPRARYLPAHHPVVEQFLARILPRRVLDRLFGGVLGLRAS